MMMRTVVRFLPLALGVVLAGCVAPAEEEPIRVMRSDADGVVLRGLIDATRTAPPPRYDTMAQAECAKAGKAAVFSGMVQHSTFAFDVTYTCGAAG